MMQGNSSAPRGGEGLIISGPVCMLSDKRACLESAAAQSSGLARHGSMTKQQQQQLFIPTNVTPDVERRLYVSTARRSSTCQAGAHVQLESCLLWLNEHCCCKAATTSLDDFCQGLDNGWPLLHVSMLSRHWH